MKKIGILSAALALCLGLSACSGAASQPSTQPSAAPQNESEPVDVVVSAMLLSHLDDESAKAHLRELAGTASRALVIDSSVPDGLSSRLATGRSLLRFVTTGRDARSRDAVGELARTAGWTAGARHALGWGVVADELIRDTTDTARR